MKKVLYIITIVTFILSPLFSHASNCLLPDRLKLSSVEFEIGELSGVYKIKIDLGIANRKLNCSEKAFLVENNDITKNPIKMTVTNLASGKVTVENYFRSIDIIRRTGSEEPYKVNLTNGTVLDDRVYLNFENDDDFIISLTNANNQNIRYGKNPKFNY